MVEDSAGILRGELYRIYKEWPPIRWRVMRCKIRELGERTFLNGLRAREPHRTSMSDTARTNPPLSKVSPENNLPLLF